MFTDKSYALDKNGPLKGSYAVLIYPKTVEAYVLCKSRRVNT